MNQLHPGAKWLFRINAYIFFFVISLVIGWFVVPAISLILIFFINSKFSFVAIILSTLVYILFAVIISEIYARMAYTRWFYEFTNDGLRLERGIIWKRYSNVPYERIQNVDVHRGVIARMLGFSSLMIQTAGYSAQPHAEGYIPALEMNLAEQIRTFVMKKITSRRGR